MAAGVGTSDEMARMKTAIGIDIHNLKAYSIDIGRTSQRLCITQHLGAQFIIGVKEINIISGSCIKTSIASCCSPRLGLSEEPRTNLINKSLEYSMSVSIAVVVNEDNLHFAALDAAQRCEEARKKLLTIMNGDN